MPRGDEGGAGRAAGRVLRGHRGAGAAGERLGGRGGAGVGRGIVGVPAGAGGGRGHSHGNPTAYHRRLRAAAGQAESDSVTAEPYSACDV